ncbi:MAG: hypothetical protein IT563_14280 [Alphaproteobacteria bacterium]|nr:hypothetical protein [Alphaproteobacteria bacterium]
MSGVARLTVAKRFPFAEGHEFGEAGAYEYLSGRADFAVDPAAPDLQAVTDIRLAPVDAAGKVRFAADFALLKPVDPKRSNRRLFFDYGNRGNKRCLQFFNDAVGSNEPRAPEHAGNGFLFRRGYTVGWLGWQGDLQPGEGRMLLDLPVATEGGKPITGTVRVEYVVTEPGVHCLPLSGQAAAKSYPAVSLDTRGARLTRRRYADSERVAIAPEAWQFARLEFGSTVDGGGRERAVIPCDTHIYVEAGFEPGWIYELVYAARDPIVLGLGHVAVRDFVSFLKHGDEGNPLKGGVEKAYAWGRSQTGRCIRDSIYLGFNADAQNRRVFDGVLPHVAGGGRMWMNQRFAQIMPLPGQEYENHFTPVDRFPFAYARSKDHLTGKADAILKRPDTDPLVIQTDTASEYWLRRGSLAITDTAGNDLEPPAGVRHYLWSSSQHYADPLMKQPAKGICVYPANVVVTSMLFRAVLDMLDRWASGGTAPPASRIPRRKDGTLVAAEEWRRQYPAIPGAVIPKGPSKLDLLDFGPDIDRGFIAKEPPTVVAGKRYAVQVPAVDEDGNDVAGVRAPMVQAPLATYNGWNMRAHGFGYGAMGPIVGSTIAFPDTPQERAATGDPRRSILERYGDKAGYVRAITEAARRLVAEGFLLEEDVERAAQRAADWGRPRHDVRLD